MSAAAPNFLVRADRRTYTPAPLRLNVGAAIGMLLVFASATVMGLLIAAFLWVVL